MSNELIMVLACNVREEAAKCSSRDHSNGVLIIRFNHLISCLRAVEGSQCTETTPFRTVLSFDYFIHCLLVYLVYPASFPMYRHDHTQIYMY